MIVYDLFCGAGGVSEGMATLGLQPVGWDYDPDACATHEAAGHTTIREDLALYEWSDTSEHRLFVYRQHVDRVDILHASPPCQPFSGNGDGDGDGDLRDGMPHTLRAVAALHPDLVTVENVPGLTSTRHRPYLDRFCIDLVDLGYWVEWRLLDAADFGVPQHRQRLWIVAVPDDGDPDLDDSRVAWPEPTHTEKTWVPISDVVSFLRGGAVLNTGLDWKKGGTRADAQTRPLNRPAPTVGTKSGGQWRWQYDDDDWEPVDSREVAALQGFRPDYPWQGGKGSVDRQIGNAVPPAMAAAVIGANLPKMSEAINEGEPIDVPTTP